MSATDSPLHILLVEDDEYLRDTIGLLFEEFDCVVDPVGSAEQALTRYDPALHRVVVTDISLPGRSGVDLARQLLERDPDTWLVFSSGYQLDAGLRQLGPNVRSLAKPFDLEDIERLLQEIRSAAG